MNDPLGVDGWTAAKAAWGIIVTGLSYLGLRALGRVDKNSEEIARLRAVVVTREEVDARFEEAKQDRDALRESLIGSMENAVQAVDASNERVMDQFRETQNIILKKLLEK